MNGNDMIEYAEKFGKNYEDVSVEEVQAYYADAYDRYRDDQMLAREEAEKKSRARFAFLDLSIPEFNKYCDEMIK